MITQEDIDELGSPPEVYPTAYQMVKEYHKTAKLDQDVDMTEDNLKFRLDLIMEELDELLTSLHEGDKENALKELSDLMYVVAGFAVTYGWNLDEAFYRVHKNNMGRMYQPDGSIKTREDGKVLKNKNYPKVNLKDLFDV